MGDEGGRTLIILVNGLLGFNSGKTSVASAVLQRARREAVNILAVKPRSSHNYWEHYDHSRRCQEAGRLVSRDATALRALCPDPPALELMNPHHQVVCPLDLEAVSGSQPHLVGHRDELVLAERVTTVQGETTLFVNRREDQFVATPGFLERVKERADRVVPFHASPVEEELANFQQVARGIFERLVEDREHLLVESFSDVVLPVEITTDELDLIVSVGASLVLLFDPVDIARAMEVVGSPRMASFLRYVKPLETFRVPHLTTMDREEGDVLVGAYGEVLDALWTRLELQGE